MFFKEVSFLESAQYSPWPNRILGIESWQKTCRSKEEILKEYNNFWYKKALDLWHNFTMNQSLQFPSRFFNVLDRLIYNEMLANKDIYRSYENEHLFSVNQRLFLGSWFALNALSDNCILETMQSYQDQYDFSALVEMGCGTGKNLFKLYENLIISRIIGGEICNNAVSLGNNILASADILGKFDKFDYYEDNGVSDLTQGLVEKYALFTVHSIEQINFSKTTLVEQILQIKHKPDVILHFEPVIDIEDHSIWGKFRGNYVKLNLYNDDLLTTLKRYAARGAIEILEIRKDVFGISPFNPFSIIAWKCCR